MKIVGFVFWESASFRIIEKNVQIITKFYVPFVSQMNTFTNEINASKYEIDDLAN